MCWCMKLSCTIVSNLFNRMCNGFMDLYYTCCSNVEAEDQYECASLKDNNLDMEKIRGCKGTEITNYWEYIVIWTVN